MPREIKLIDVETQVASDSTGGVRAARPLSAWLTVTAINAGTFDAKLQESFDGGITWVDTPGGGFTQVTAATTSEAILPTDIHGGGTVRLDFTLAGGANDVDFECWLSHGSGA